MSFATLETAIINELREVTKKRSLKKKDMMEWSSSEEVVRKNVQPDETVIHCPLYNVWVAIKTTKLG